MTIDKYTKFILTLIAVGVLGLNFHLFKGDIVKEAYAASGAVQKIALCSYNGEDCFWPGENELRVRNVGR